MLQDLITRRVSSAYFLIGYLTAIGVKAPKQTEMLIWIAEKFPEEYDNAQFGLWETMRKNNYSARGLSSGRNVNRA